MPVNKIDYSKTIIYRIVCKDTNITDCYVGKTTDLRSRKTQHKNTCNNENDRHYNIYIYQFIRNNGGWFNWDMVEIEKYEAIDSNDALKRERYWIEFYKASLNKVIPLRTPNEYYKDNNREKLKEQDREYREKNKEKRKETITCQCGFIGNKYHLSRHQKTQKHLNAINNI